MESNGNSPKNQTFGGNMEAGTKFRGNDRTWSYWTAANKGGKKTPKSPTLRKVAKRTGLRNPERSAVASRGRRRKGNASEKKKKRVPDHHPK